MVARIFYQALLCIGLLAGLLAAPLVAGATEPPQGFVRLRSLAPSIQQDIRYATAFNFTAKIVPGYTAAECVLTRKAAEALHRAESKLNETGYGLKVFDCYRPVRAVRSFERWMDGTSGDQYAGVFYPTLDRKNLAALGYIAKKSSHSRGSTVDIGLVKTAEPPLPTPSTTGRCDGPFRDRPHESSLDLGTSFDCFSALSALANGRAGPTARTNRNLLRAAMLAAGFKGYAREWWHFTLVDEPFPNTEFDFEVE